MRRRTPAVIAAAIAHGLAWVASMFFVFGPVYRGVSGVAVTPGQAGGVQQQQFTSSLVEQNGLWVLWLLAVPLAFTGLGLLAAWRAEVWRVRSMVVSWVSAVLLLVGCFLAIWSIGLFYVPSALALLVAAILGSRSRATTPTT